MLRTICEDFSFILVRNRIVSEEDREIYIYGLELILNSLVAIGTIVILGFLLNKVLITAVFLIVFCSIRSYSGGYHANQYWKCYCIGCLTYLSVVMLAENISIHSSGLYSLSMLIISYIGIFLMAPQNSDKNPKTRDEIRKNNITTKALTSLYTLIATIGIFAYPNANKLWFTIACTQLVVTIFLMITILQRRYVR